MVWGGQQIRGQLPSERWFLSPVSTRRGTCCRTGPLRKPGSVKGTREGVHRILLLDGKEWVEQVSHGVGFWSAHLSTPGRLGFQQSLAIQKAQDAEAEAYCLSETKVKLWDQGWLLYWLFFLSQWPNTRQWQFKEGKACFVPVSEASACGCLSLCCWTECSGSGKGSGRRLSTSWQVKSKLKQDGGASITSRGTPPSAMSFSWAPPTPENFHPFLREQHPLGDPSLPLSTESAEVQERFMCRQTLSSCQRQTLGRQWGFQVQGNKNTENKAKYSGIPL